MIQEFLCPTNPLRPANGKDSLGYGYVDYMPIAYSNLVTNPAVAVGQGQAFTYNAQDAGGTVDFPAAAAAYGVPLNGAGIGKWPGGLATKYADTTNGAAASAGAVPVALIDNPGAPVGVDGNPGQFVIDYSLPITQNRLKNGSKGPNVGEITDGLAHTVFMTEDVGRVEGLGTPSYLDPIGTDIPAANTGHRASWRWAEPDTANGLSGPDLSGNGFAAYMAYGSTQGNGRVINNSSVPQGGPAACPWSYRNCGPNDEPFSFHANGCNVMFGDGSVRFIKQDIDPRVFGKMVTPIEGVASGFAE